MTPNAPRYVGKQKMKLINDIDQIMSHTFDDKSNGKSNIPTSNHHL